MNVGVMRKLLSEEEVLKCLLEVGEVRVSITNPRKNETVIWDLQDCVVCAIADQSVCSHVV